MPARMLRLLTIVALLLGMQAAASLPVVAAVKPSEASMPLPVSHCQDCGNSAMPAAQCAAVCVFVLLPSGEPAATIAPINRKLRPAVAAMPLGWSMPPETAPPRS